MNRLKSYSTRDGVCAVSNMAGEAPAAAVELLTASGLSKTYKRHGWFSRQRDAAAAALSDVSLSISAGRTLGLVGESGAGKSTLARCLACLELPDTGEIRLQGKDLLTLPRRDLSLVRRQLQLIFQGSAATLNPAFSAIEIVTEPLLIAGIGNRRDRRDRGVELMERAGLSRSIADRRCTELSGGQRQRLAIARALALRPKVLILDESLSGLDLPVQARIVNLLLDLQASLSVGYVFISHDLRLAAHVSDDLAVMQGGRIVEYGPAEQVARNPVSPHARALLAAARPNGWRL